MDAQTTACDIYPMRVDDLKEVAALEQATSPAPWSPGIFLDCLRAGHDCWVLRADRVVGFAIASLGAGEVHLLNLVVTPSKQGLGFGGRLLRKVIGMARTNGAERIFLEVRPSNIRAQAIYQRAGFKLLSRRPKYYGQPQQEDALVYTLVI